MIGDAMIIGGCLMIVGSILWIISIAFSNSHWWGISVIFLPIASIIFIVLNLRDTLNPLAFIVFGCLIEYGGIMLGGTSSFMLSCMDLKEIPFFKSLPDEIVEKFCQMAVFEDYKDGDIVYREGDAADCFYIILQGEAFALKKIEAGKEEEKSIGILIKGDMLGQIGGSGEGVRFVTLKAKGALKVMKVSRAKMIKFLEEDREMATQFFLEFIGQLFDIVRFLTAEQIALYETGRLIASAGSEEEFLREIVAIIKRGAPSANSGFVALYNSFTDQFEIRAGRDSKGSPFAKTVFTKDEPLVKHLIEERQFFEGNPSKDSQIWDEAFARAVAALCYPILAGEKLLGFITLFSTEKEDAFTAEQKNFLIGICNMLAPALEAAELKKEDERRQRLERHMY